MPTIFSTIPIEALGKSLANNPDQLWRELRRLDCREHLIRAAALNNVVSDLLLEQKFVQVNAMRLMLHDHWIDRESHSKLGWYLRDHTEQQFVYFGRQNFLELYRWLAIGASENADAAKSVRSQQAFIRSILYSYHWAEQRVQLPMVVNAASGSDILFNSLPVIREMAMFAPGVTNVFALIGRAKLLMDKHFFASHPEYKQKFESSGITVDQYRHCALILLANALAVRPEKLKSLEGAYVFDINGLCEYQPDQEPILRRFLELEAMDLDALKAEYEGNTLKDFLSLRPLRSRPVFRIDDNTVTPLDITMLAERATYGPLFYDIGAGQLKFDHFGDAFEQYVNDELLIRASHLGCTSKPQFNPKDGEIELCDALLRNEQQAIFIESKGVWLNEAAIERETAEEFWNEIRNKYVQSKTSGKGKGVAQLAKHIRDILDGKLACPNGGLANVKEVFPVLLVHDAQLVTPHFGYFFAKEFWPFFGLSAPPPEGSLVYNTVRVYSVIVMSIVEFENLEHFGSKQNFFEYLKAYANWDPRRMRNIREFGVNHWQVRIEPPDRSHAMKVGRELLSEASVSFLGRPLDPL